ncbi:hypothetical protein P7C73_g5784, partial [Tremellales sp. Uapishka_1]
MVEVDHAEVTKVRPKEVKKEKVVPPSPPLTIKDKERGYQYARVGFLGEGGFARVYEVQNQRAQRKAVKVVNKASIKSKRNKTKLWAEIKLHQMLQHPHIVGFEDCFEDDENVYMVLELCENGSLMDLMRRRKRLPEAEARFYLVQLISACQHMHEKSIIHRDLKLGNLFLDANMDIKVGDFGLAALIENGDRKTTICGTPNYIAPEVLFDQANGHSFEVDIWSIGVIIYTLLIGKPPFQTKDVNTIYKRIKDNRYEFPPDKPITPAAENLIMSVLNPNPDKRPSLDDILKHPFFHNGPFPAFIPISANDTAPDFHNLTAAQSSRNFERLCARAYVGGKLPIVTDNSRLKSALGPSILQQERDFKKAVQPDSPISALIKYVFAFPVERSELIDHSSARQPLVQAPTAIKEPSLLRKLADAGAVSTMSPVRRKASRLSAGSHKATMAAVGEEDEEEEPENLEHQKMRIVSQMATSTHRPAFEASPRRALGPATTLPQRNHAPAPPQPQYQEPSKPRNLGAGLFDLYAENLVNGLEMGSGFRTPNIPLEPPAPKIFVISWLDYCTKYGMGFAMTDGTVTVHFNDSTCLALSPGKQHFDHIQPATQGDLVQGIRKNYAIDDHPKDLNNKVYLLRHFEGYMMDKLVGNQEYTWEDKALTRGMVFVTKYLRMKHVILFRLSNDVLQFNFYDHSKLILSSGGLVVSLIDKHYVLRTWSLEALLRPQIAEQSEKARARHEKVLHKVQYARDVLVKIRSHASTKSTTPKLSPTKGGEAIPQPRSIR